MVIETTFKDSKKLKELNIIKIIIISKMQSIFVFLDMTKVADF